LAAFVARKTRKQPENTNILVTLTCTTVGMQYCAQNGYGRLTHFWKLIPQLKEKMACHIGNKKSKNLFQDIMQDKAMIKMSAVHNAGKSGSESEICTKCAISFTGLILTKMEAQSVSTLTHSHTIMPISVLLS
jgi:hypothetical protein